ncbi:membrane integrity lipid transport subunit YebS [Proteus sp. G2626]|uniref:membrane integrity lipid transport subunit YebS n=1 Tax=Proteus sp. G2626 TaxID=2698842 RepID=UPI001377219F|nr:membrane integrity lipid transport subunit YebS [Proteus sp. G2626]NBN46623.1 membrane integrity lipid transport subunit YebS [Proteus sp. G2626]
MSNSENDIATKEIKSIRCQECDHLVALPLSLKRGEDAYCPRCQAKLASYRDWSLTRLLILSITMLILASIAFTQPLIKIHLLGTMITANVLDGIRMMSEQGSPLTATMVVFCAVAAPLSLPIAILYLHLGARLRFNLRPVLLMLGKLKEWVMLDVYLIGLGVATIKLDDYATVYIGNGLIAFISLMLLSLLMLINLNMDQLWQRFYPQKTIHQSPATCHACHYHFKKMPSTHCPRCKSCYTRRQPMSLQKTWAALITAIILLLPANLLPISIFYLNGQRTEDTIFSGVIALVNSGNTPIAIIVFIASIFVPFFKIIIMLGLLLSIHFNSHLDPLFRMKLYRFVSWIGRWSMLDLFVIALMMSLINRDQLMTFTMGPAAFYFGTAVILTILAVEWLDSRLLWDTYATRRKRRSGNTSPNTPQA